MATADHDNMDVTISSEAIGLLDCFSDGLDGVLYQLAEHIAISRATSGLAVEVVAEDIEKAANELAEILQQAKLPKDVQVAVQSMQACLSHKLDK